MADDNVKSLLIVEDAMMVGLHLRKSLEHAGYRVVDTVTNGADAIARARQEHPDLILMDIMLEGDLDGVETAKEIRKEQDIPVIYLTALSDVETIQRAKITDPFGYVMKPFNERELHTNIEMALHKYEVEQKLRISEERFFSAINAIPAPLLTLDQQAKITFVNPTVVQILRNPIQALRGKFIYDVLTFSEINSQMPTINWWKELHEKEALPGPFRLKEDEEERVFGDISLVPLIHPSRESSGYLFSFRNITTEFKTAQLKKEIERQNLAKLIEGQESERTRVARDLHDSLGQMLSGIKLHIDTNLSLNCDAEHTDPLRALLDEAIQETTRISENLLPSALKDLSLYECLKGLCSKMGRIFAGNITLESAGIGSKLPQSQKIGVYRVVQEAINNAMKHSQAQNINVQLTFHESSLDLTIEDDGVGFDIAHKGQPGDHHGLQNMHDRALIMKGELTIETSPELGTLIHLHSPIH